MIEIAHWLLFLEHMAGKLYRHASIQFREDESLSKFLNHLAEDETWHYDTIGKAIEYLGKEGSFPQSILLDNSTKERIEAPVIRNYQLASSGGLTRESLLECIITSEYSEWNHIFLFVVNTLKLKNRDFAYVASKMRNHMREIETFFHSLPSGEKYIQKIKGLPGILKNRILIVDDTEPVVEYLKAVLEGESAVEIARNGKDGLEKLKETYFDVVISDIEMPEMNGIRFYQEASGLDSNLRERFLFFTGSHDPEHFHFIEKNNVRYLQKPAPLDDIRKTVNEIILGMNA